MDRHRRFGAKRVQPPLVGGAERAKPAVEDLHHADHARAPGDDGHAQQAAGPIAGAPVDFRIETRVLVSIQNVDHAARGEAFPRNAGIRGEADLRAVDAVRGVRKQFIALGVVQEEGSALGVQKLRRRRQDLGEQRPEADFRDDRTDDFEQHCLLALLALDFFEQARVLERGSGLLRQPLEQALILGVEVPGVLVQDLRDADHFAALVADRHAQDISGAITGAPVDLLVEALVVIGVRRNDFRLSLGEYRTGDADVAGKADFPHRIALHHARVQFPGFGIVQEQGTAIGAQRVADHLHQTREQHVEREAVGNPVGDVGDR